MAFLKRVVRGSIFLSYALIALEIIIMVSPFAFYFYSIYGPFLKGLYAFPPTRWLTAFILPHILFSGDPMLNWSERVGFYLFPIGLWIFIIGAVHVYGAKLFRKGPVTNGLYAFVRHPQYLGLIVSGLGLFLFWPRFFILVMYVTMVFIYYHLARHEEREMEGRYGEKYLAYKRKTGMFLPFNLGGRFSFLIGGWGFERGLSPVLMYGLILSITVGFGFLLREYTKGRIPSFYLKGKNTRVVYSFPRKDADMRRIINFALDDERTQSLMEKSHLDHGASYIAHIVPSHHGMGRLIATEDEILRRPRRIDWENLRFPIRLLVPFIGGSHHSEHCRTQKETLRVIFSKLSSPDGEYIPESEAFSINAMRTPLFLVEVDSETGEVLQVVETMPRHFWGDMPMPAF
jgi:hypothetical protein